MSASQHLYNFFFQAEDGIRDWSVTGVQTCALPISLTKEELVNLAPHIQEKVNSLEKIKQEISRMKMKLEGDISIVKIVNKFLSKQVTELVRQV